MNRSTLLVFVLGIAIGILVDRLGGLPIDAQTAPARREYRVLQDQELHALAAARRKEDLQAKLNKLGDEGWELVNPCSAYVTDKGFVVATGPLPADSDFQDRRLVLILRR